MSYTSRNNNKNKFGTFCNYHNKQNKNECHHLKHYMIEYNKVRYSENNNYYKNNNFQY